MFGLGLIYIATVTSSEGHPLLDGWIEVLLRGFNPSFATADGSRALRDLRQDGTTMRGMGGEFMDTTALTRR
ncbi:MAG: hypothetical protein JWO94_2423 [Verrucomicrobiaceae bacterium]|nr:hypothetical protein [Verrucomicrobiaceae bacterium]